MRSVEQTITARRVEACGWPTHADDREALITRYAGHMKGDDFIARLGKPFTDPAIEQWLVSLGIPAKKPKVTDGTGYLHKKPAGLELTFRAANRLDVPPPTPHPRGTIVLSNVRMYGIAVNKFSPYTGALPRGLVFGDDRAAVASKLGGEPAVANEELGFARWDFADHCIFVDFDEAGRANLICVQLPVQ